MELNFNKTVNGEHPQEKTEMANLQQLLNGEIRRLARKELAAAVKEMKAQIVEMRKVISEQNRRLKALENAAPCAAAAAENKVAEKGAPAEAAQKGMRITAERIRKWRKKLGVNQAQYAKLLGVNTISVSHWESGKNVPREAQKRKIAELRDLGVRELKKLMQEKQVVAKAAKKEKPAKAAKKEAAKVPAVEAPAAEAAEAPAQ